VAVPGTISDPCVLFKAPYKLNFNTKEYAVVVSANMLMVPGRIAGDISCILTTMFSGVLLDEFVLSGAALVSKDFNTYRESKENKEEGITIPTAGKGSSSLARLAKSPGHVLGTVDVD